MLGPPTNLLPNGERVTSYDVGAATNSRQYRNRLMKAPSQAPKPANNTSTYTGRVLINAVKCLREVEVTHIPRKKSLREVIKKYSDPSSSTLALVSAFLGGDGSFSSQEVVNFECDDA